MVNNLVMFNNLPKSINLHLHMKFLFNYFFFIFFFFCFRFFFFSYHIFLIWDLGLRSQENRANMFQIFVSVRAHVSMQFSKYIGIVRESACFPFCFCLLFHTASKSRCIIYLPNLYFYLSILTYI